MTGLSSLKYFFWIIRGKEKDIINIYNSITSLVQAANGGRILNRGYWDTNTKSSLHAQYQLCKLIGEFSDFDSAETLLDVGSGLSVPAIHWKSTDYTLKIICIDLNFAQSKSAIMDRLLSNENLKDIFLVNATATVLPFADHSMDRIVALESHQHFKPLDQFINECKRVLKYNGVLVIATPVKTTIANGLMGLIKFGILFLMLRSENYVLANIESSIIKGGFRINEILPIGSHIYEPLADHYLQNRYILRENLLKRYPRFVEYILYKSLLKTKDAYKKGIIDYVLIKCSPA